MKFITQFEIINSKSCFPILRQKHKGKDNMFILKFNFQYLENIPSEKSHGSITSPYGWPSDGVLTINNVDMR